MRTAATDRAEAIEQFITASRGAVGRSIDFAIHGLLKVATPLFHSGICEHSLDPKMQDEAFDHWYTLRHIAALWESRRSLHLSPSELEGFSGALLFAHDRAHGTAGLVRVDLTCECETAQHVRELMLMQLLGAAAGDGGVRVI